MVGAFLAFSLALSADAPRFRATIETGQKSPPASATLRTRSREGQTETRDCVIADRVAVCSLGAGTFDAELHVKGYAPVYYWAINAESGRDHDAGVVRLTPGSTVDGTVADRRVPVKGAVIELRP